MTPFARVFLCAVSSAALAGHGTAQVYPKWFLDQGDLGCAGSAAGVAVASYYPDSTGGEAFRAGVENFVRNRCVMITGGKQLLATEEGTTVVSTTVRESFDTSQVEPCARSARVLARFSCTAYAIVLAGSVDCPVPAPLLKLVSIDSLPPPVWVWNPPEDSVFNYACGMSEPYFYEASCWMEAEKNARLELSRSISSKIRSIEKLDKDEIYGASEISVRDEDISATLRDIEVIHRWRSLRSRLYYVLIRSPR